METIVKDNRSANFINGTFIFPDGDTLEVISPVGWNKDLRST